MINQKLAMKDRQDLLQSSMQLSSHYQNRRTRSLSADASPKAPRKNSPGKGKQEQRGEVNRESAKGEHGGKEESKDSPRVAMQDKQGTPTPQMSPPMSQPTAPSFKPTAPVFKPVNAIFQPSGNWQASQPNTWNGPQPWKPRPPGFGWGSP